ncbi:hypothetical protein GZL_02031 [Streptomyces sp. 769]|nr:hypothetical protein GZL_02031 [Streptomyces sp. 769]
MHHRGNRLPPAATRPTRHTYPVKPDIRRPLSRTNLDPLPLRVKTGRTRPRPGAGNHAAPPVR